MNTGPVQPRGFSLIEILITTLLLGVLMTLLAPVFVTYRSAAATAADEKAVLDNQRIGAALLAYAATATVLGTLPAPYNGSGYVSTVFNPGDASTAGIALTQALGQSGVAPNAVNDNGTAGRQVRVYQRVAGVQQVTPLFVRSGPLVVLAYDFGVVYQTRCGRDDGTCNPNPSTGLPGDSTVLTAGNLSTWSTTGRDGRPHMFSTLPRQQGMLATTARRLDRVRDALITTLRARQLTASAGDATNFFPPSPATLGGASPASNQGCRDGWYSLATSNVLPLTGLAPEEFGVTAWGAPIEYCRDYDPTGTKAPNAAPHYAALRFNAAVSTGAPPDPAVPGNNVLLTL